MGRILPVLSDFLGGCYANKKSKSYLALCLIDKQHNEKYLHYGVWRREMCVKKFRNDRKRASNQGIAMVLGQGGVYNSRVLSGLNKTSHKSISCVFFALCGADVDTENWLKVTCPMLQLSNYIVNRRWCARSLSTSSTKSHPVPARK